MSEEFTGDSGTRDVALSNSSAWRRNTQSSDARCVAYDVPREQSASDRKSRVLLPPEADRADTKSSLEKERERTALRQLLGKLKVAANDFLDAVREGDHIEQGILGCDLLVDLQALWEKRGVREEEWSESLNFLQAAVLKEEFERFNSKQALAVKTALDILAGGTVDPEDVLRVRRVLRESGLDPWKAISAMSEEDNG